MAQKKAKSGRELALQELRKEIKDLPEDGLRFLLEQAKVIRYNMKVDELNAEKEKLLKSKTTLNSAANDDIYIEKGYMGNSMVLVARNERKMMDEEEIFALVKIAHNSKTKKEGGDRLYRWLDKERDDVLLDMGIDEGDPVLGSLYSCLRKHFSLGK